MVIKREVSRSNLVGWLPQIGHDLLTEISRFLALGLIDDTVCALADNSDDFVLVHGN